jgi:hypothetical protein
VSTMSARDAIRAQMAAEQAPVRKMSLAAIAARMLVAPVVLCCIAAIVMSPARTVFAAVPSLLIFAIAGVVAAGAFVLAPRKPALAEKVARGSVVVMAVAFAAELMQHTDTPVGGMVGCSMTTLGFGAVACALLMVFSRFTRFPFRRMHKVAGAVACVGVMVVPLFRHCPNTSFVHLLICHVVVPVVLCVVFVAAPGWQRRAAT